jgi:membrane-associated protease RseP (regulator of RpoE activity)
MAAPTTADNPLLPCSQEFTDSPQKTPHSIAWLPLCLLVVSIFTTASTGALLTHNFSLDQPPLASEGDLFPLHWIWNHPSTLASGWSFSLALLGILLAHEAGHYFFCRRHGINASWPYVLPAPTLSGTAGAVIRIRSRIPSRQALIEVGIAGPIAGYLVALPTTVLGLLLSRPVDAGTAPALAQFHQPLTVALLDRALAACLPGVPALPKLLPHPILIASWVGLFVTSLNLIPAGQLDGGHILYAISPRWHRRLTFVVPVLLLAMGVTLWTGWVLWGLILLLPAMRHPHVPYFPRMPYRHRWLGLLALAILLLTFLPAPFTGTSILDLFR